MSDRLAVVLWWSSSGLLVVYLWSTNSDCTPPTPPHRARIQTGTLGHVLLERFEKRCLQRFPYPTHTHPSIHPLIAFKPVYTKAFRCCDFKFKIGALRLFLSENTFAGHWETGVDCMENIEKRQQWLILPKNCLRTQLWFNQNIRNSIKKFRWQRHLEAVYDIRSG